LYSFRIESNTEVTIRFEISNIRTALVIIHAGHSIYTHDISCSTVCVTVKSCWMRGSTYHLTILGTNDIERRSKVAILHRPQRQLL